MQKLSTTEEHMLEFFKTNSRKYIISNDDDLLAHYRKLNCESFSIAQNVRYVLANLFKKNLLTRKKVSVKQTQMGLPQFRKIFHYRLKEV
jgi:hypothetical protein